MECVFEFLGELFIEGAIEILWMIFPSAKLSEKKKNVIEACTKIALGILICVFFFGSMLALAGDSTSEKNLGVLLIFISVAVVILYVALTVIASVIVNKRKKK